MEVLPEISVIDRAFLSAPAGAKSPAGAHDPGAASRRNLRRILGTVTLAWTFGSVWSMTSTGEPLTLFAQKLGASNFQFGLLTALPYLAALLSVAGSLLVDWTGLRKQVFLTAFYPQRAMWFVIALAPLSIISRQGMGASREALSVFLWLMFVMYAVGAVGSPAWTCWMADLVPGRINGAYFSRRRQWGNLTAIPAAIFVGWLFDHVVGPDDMSVLRWCAIVFLCCAVCGLTDIHLFQYVPAISRPRKNGASLLKSLREPFANKQFLRFSLFVGILTFAVNLLGQFATLYLLDQAGASNLSVQMILVVAPMVGQLLVLGIWGRAADRMGKRPLLILASIGLVPVAIGWCFVMPGRLWLGYVLSGLGAALWAGVEVANFNLVLESSGGPQAQPGGQGSGGSSFAAVNTVIINLAGCLGGLSAGVLAQMLGDWHCQPSASCKNLSFYDVLFLASAVLRLLAVVMLVPLIHEPAARSTRQALRFVMAGLTAMVIGLSLRPIRLLVRHSANLLAAVQMKRERA
jgi:MFS family permease